MKTVRYSYGITTALLASGAALTLMTGFPAGAQVAQNDRLQMENAVPRAGAPASFADLTEALQPAVVNISTRQTITIENSNPFEGTPFGDMFGRRGGSGGPVTQEAQSLGSGFIISADGYVVTNNHVVSPDQRAQLQSVTVTLPNGEEYEAEVVGTDPESDLAVLKISRAQPFPFVRFGDSAQARVGDWVIAIGNPFGLGGTVTSGIVSAVMRNTTGGFNRYIQTDASINRGNSGGPLFDMQGNVIGINNAIFSPSGGNVGIGFAIPAETAAPIVKALIEGETIERGYLGVRIQPVSEDMAEALGIDRNRGEIIQMVVPGEPAAQAGLQADDIVLTVNGQNVTRDQTLSYMVAAITPGQRAQLGILRGGERRTINVTVGKRPSQEELAQQDMFSDNEDEAEPSQPAPGDEGDGLLEGALGVRGVNMTAEFARQLGVDSDTQGVAITDVNRNSDAARKGLARGTIILQANGRNVASISDLEAILREVRSSERQAVLLRVKPRRGQPVSVAVRLMAE